MPCTDGGYCYDPDEKKRLDLATRVACECFKFMEENFPQKMKIHLSAEALKWREDHKKADAKRIADEIRSRNEEKIRIKEQIESLNKKLAGMK